MTLKSVAESAGCSESMLSKIETGRVLPTLQLLARIAEALQTTIAALFDESADQGVIVHHAGRRPSLEVGARTTGGERVRLERLVPSADGRLLNANLHVVPPGGGSEGQLNHPGEEVGFVVEGVVELTVDGTAHVLSAGASFYFLSSLPHSYRNVGDREARIVWVNTPPY